MEHVNAVASIADCTYCLTAPFGSRAVIVHVTI